MVTPSKSKKPTLQDQDPGLLPTPTATQHHYHHHQNSVFVLHQQCHHRGHTLQVKKSSPPRPRPWPIYCTTASFPPPTLSLSSTMRQSWSHHHVQKLSPLRPRLTHLNIISHHDHVITSKNTSSEENIQLKKSHKGLQSIMIS